MSGETLGGRGRRDKPRGRSRCDQWPSTANPLQDLNELTVPAASKLGTAQRTMPWASVRTNPGLADVPSLGQEHATFGLNFCPGRKENSGATFSTSFVNTSRSLATTGAVPNSMTRIASAVIFTPRRATIDPPSTPTLDGVA